MTGLWAGRSIMKCTLCGGDSGRSQDERPKLESTYKIGAHVGRLRRCGQRGKKISIMSYFLKNSSN